MYRSILGAAACALLVSGSAFAENSLAADTAFTLVQKGELVLLDVRTPTEWAMTGMPRDAYGVTLQDTDFVAQARGAVQGDLDSPVAVICKSGTRSHAAAQKLESAGFSHVYDISEGMSGNEEAGDGWINRGLPVDAFIPPNY